MGLFSLANLFGITLRESANDGSDFTNPDADYRRVFLGEDGALHAKDSAGTVTTIASGDVTAHAGAADPHTGYVLESLIDAAGDLYIGSADNTVARLARGTDGQALRSTGSTIAWENIDEAFQVIIDGGGSAVTTGAKGFFRIPYAGTIVEAWMLSDVSSTTTVDLWKDTVANHPATDADSITSATPLAISAADSVVDTTLSSWTTSVTAGDTIRVNVDANNNATILNVGITVRRT